VPATGGRRGRRDNGLVAAAYAAVGDIDPRIGEHLLDVLATNGIAAYLQPSTDQHPITRTTSLPARPTDRLFVDRDHVGTARDYVRQVNTEPDRSDPAVEAAMVPTPDRDPDKTDTDPGSDDRAAREHAAWEEIVAGFNVKIDPEDIPWPKSEEVTLGEPRPLPVLDPPTDSPPRRRRTDREEPSLLDALDTFGMDLPDEPTDDEGYTPPPPPPLPRISKAAALGIAAIGFGLLLFIWPALLPLSGDTVLLLAFGAIVAGFVTLIWRLRPGDDEDDLDDPDDGARI